jgi:hypothetical protein
MCDQVHPEPPTDNFLVGIIVPTGHIQFYEGVTNTKYFSLDALSKREKNTRLVDLASLEVKKGLLDIHSLWIQPAGTSRNGWKLVMQLIQQQEHGCTCWC